MMLTCTYEVVIPVFSSQRTGSAEDPIMKLTPEGLAASEKTNKNDISFGMRPGCVRPAAYSSEISNVREILFLPT